LTDTLTSTLTSPGKKLTTFGDDIDKIYQNNFYFLTLTSMEEFLINATLARISKIREELSLAKDTKQREILKVWLHDQQTFLEKCLRLDE
jgi:hypothetical protein